MQPANWQQFGLKKDPFDTLPLIEGGELPIEKAFVGRVTEREYLQQIFQAETRLCLAICGEVGVGKTSLANFHKFTWKYHPKKPLFSFRREIEACDTLLDKKNFLLEIIGSVLREIKLLQPNLLKKEPLRKLVQMVDISQTMAISAGASAQAIGLGVDIGFDKNLSYPMQLTTAFLEESLSSLLHFIKGTEINKRRHSGLIIHMNNFDVVLTDAEQKKKTIRFFNEIRDLLQTPDTYFLFLGPRNFFKDIISSQQRVKSIFIQTALQLNPLSKTEIIEAFEERIKLLRSNDVATPIHPIEAEVVFRLYDLYQGDIRSIMASIRDMLSQCADTLTKTLSVDEAMLLLGKERWERIEHAIKLTSEQKTILSHMIPTDQISQKDVIQLFKKAQPNVSGYYFKPLKEAGIIEEKARVGKTIYWGLTTDYLPLKEFFVSRKKLQQTLSKQLSFFENPSG